MSDFYKVDLNGYTHDLPILPIGNIKICFFNLHGAQELTEHCGKELAKLANEEVEVVITAESKGLQLAHCVARELGHKLYAVARKSQKLYMQDGISVTVKSITTAQEQTLYLSAHDTALIKGKKVAIVDDVISTGGSLKGLELLVEKAGGIIVDRLFVLAEGDASNRDNVKFLATIPIITD